MVPALIPLDSGLPTDRVFSDLTRARSSVGERSPHTREVAGSKPAAPIHIARFTRLGRLGFFQMTLTNEQLGTLYGRHSEELYRYFRSRVLDRQAAIDLVGETFAQAVKARKRYRGGSIDEAGPWLYGIARNLVSDYHRRGYAERKMMDRLKLERAVLQSDVEEPELTPEEASALVVESLEKLKPEYREAIELRYLANQEYAHVASALGVSEDVARTRVSRGIRRLRKLAFDAESAEGRG